MAKRLEEFPALLETRKKKYPWDEWMDGSIWIIERGIDFSVAFTTMQGYLYQQAIDNRQNVRTGKRDGKIVFQFSPLKS